MANPPKPVERKRRTGNPGKRALPDRASLVALAPASPQAPEHLGPAGVVWWDRARAHAVAWLGASDEGTLLLLCEAADRRAELLARVENDGPVMFTDKGYAYPHPCVGMVSSLEQQMTRWLSLLGFTPTDRSRLGLAEVKAATRLEALRAQRAKASG